VRCRWEVKQGAEGNRDAEGGGGRWEGEGERGKVGIGDREVGDGATRKMGERRWGMSGGVWNQVRRWVGGRYIDWEVDKRCDE